MIDVRLAGPAAAGWAALVVTLPAPSALPVVAVGGAVVCGAFLAVRRLPILALASAVVAVLSAIAWVQPRPDDPGGRTVDVVGRVEGLPSSPSPTISVERIGPQELARPARTLVLGGPSPVDHASSEAAPTAGDLVRVTGRLASFTPGDPHALVLRGAGDVQVVERAGGAQGWAATVRARFLDLTSELPGDGGALLPGLVVGDTSRVDESLDAAMKASALSHLTAVSGANCAVVVAAVLLVLGALGIPRLARFAGAGGALAAFVVLVTPEPSVARAAVMAGLGLAAAAWGRPVRGLPPVAVATIALLIGDPWLARSFGFALSVLATAGIIVLAPPLTALLSRALPGVLAAGLAIPIAAQLACQPLLLLLDPGLPVIGVVANVLTEPAAPVATVLGLLACLVGGVSAPVGSVFAMTAWLPSAWIAAVARWSAGLPGASVRWGDSGEAVAVLVLAAVVAAGLVLARSRRPARRALSLGLAALLLPIAVVTAGASLGRRSTLPVDWQIAQCDVGQGDAVLLRSNGSVALVDTGDDARRLEACLRLLGVDALDLLVLTHFDADHVGASAALAGRVTRLVVGPRGSDADDRVVSRIGAVAVDEAVPDAVLTLGDLALRVRWPPPETPAGNEASVVLHVGPAPQCTAGCASATLTAILLGDLGAREQLRLLGRLRDTGDLPSVDVVKVAHHGSRDQARELYAAIHPRLGLIGVGADNTYGHPTPDTLGLLRGVGAEILRSDLAGTVALARDPGGEMVVWQSGEERAVIAGPAVSAAPPKVGCGPHHVAASRGTVTRPAAVDEPATLARSTAKEHHGRAHAQQGQDPPGRLGRDPPDPGDPGVGAGAVPGRPFDPAASRPARGRRRPTRGP